MTDKVYRLLYAPRRIDREISRINDRISSLKYSLLASGIRYDKDSVQNYQKHRIYLKCSASKNKSPSGKSGGAIIVLMLLRSALL